MYKMKSSPMIHWTYGILLPVFLFAVLSSSCGMPGNVPSPEAVKEVIEGKREIANAAWWGFDENDATDALQSAINSGVKKLIVPNMGKDWIVRPLKLASNQEIVFEKGTVIMAKKGEFKGRGDCLFSGTNLENITLTGYDATFRMRKKDYQSDAYEKAEWRMGLGLWSCTNIKIYGLTLAESGGDGIYLGVSGDQKFCKDIHIKDIVCDSNHRQGISVISAENLLIEKSIMKNTSGTAPRAGIDLEPNHSTAKLKNCIIRDCIMENNEGPGILVYLNPLSADSEDISILFENCKVTSEKGSGIIVGAVKDDGPGGYIKFKNCVVENTAQVGCQIYDKSADRALITFTNCEWKNVATNVDDTVTPAPLMIYLRRPKLTKKIGGVDFVDCVIEDSKNRPFLALREKESDYGIYDITGTITVKNPNGIRMDLGSKMQGVTLKAN